MNAQEPTVTSEQTDLPKAPASKKNGAALIAAFVRNLPSSPGVYRMVGEDDEILYIGKARNLKKRVASYTRPTGHANRIARMIAQTRDMEFVTTATETEALLLEANLIKRLKPRYNVILRDDKSFPYILITADHAARRILKHRGARSHKGDYFGPFASAGAVNRTLNALERAFLLRSCSDAVYDSRSRPCLLYQIKRCAAPCTGEIAPDDYAQLVEEARAFLSGRSQAVRGELVKMMEKASAGLDFERAAVYRDRLAALAHVQGQQGINPQTVSDADIFAIHETAGQFCIQVFFIRAGQNWGNRAYFPRADKSFDTGEVLASFLAQFYDDKPCPPQVLLSEETPDRALLAEALTARAERKVEVNVPRRGEKRRLADHTLANAREALARRLAETSSQARLLEQLAETFDLEGAPERIEIYDMSHISGAHALGAMVVAGPEGFIKNQYRKFNIKAEDLKPGDDYAMMREVLTRRFRRLQEAGDGADDEVPQRPDLVIVDGGLGQLNVAAGVLADLGLEDIPLAAIAKGPERDAGRERIFWPGREAFMLQPRDPVLYYLQRLRDEAHRFVIGAHRTHRTKALAASPLDEIPGIGAARKRALLAHFGSAKALSRAAIADIRAVHGISARTAQIIYDFFHEQAE